MLFSCMALLFNWTVNKRTYLTNIYIHTRKHIQYKRYFNNYKNSCADRLGINAYMHIYIHIKIVAMLLD